MSDDKKQKKDEATPKAQPSGKGSHTHLGLLPPNDPVYSTGLMVSGRKVFAEPEQTPPSPNRGMTPKESGTGGCTYLGPTPPDHEVYTMGPIVSGRPLYPPGKSSTEEGGE
jgi:hypothetical protein